MALLDGGPGGEPRPYVPEIPDQSSRDELEAQTTAPVETREGNNSTDTLGESSTAEHHPHLRKRLMALAAIAATATAGGVLSFSGVFGGGNGGATLPRAIPTAEAPAFPTMEPSPVEAPTYDVEMPTLIEPELHFIPSNEKDNGKKVMNALSAQLTWLGNSPDYIEEGIPNIFRDFGDDYAHADELVHLLRDAAGKSSPHDFHTFTISWLGGKGAKNHDVIGGIQNTYSGKALISISQIARLEGPTPYVRQFVADLVLENDAAVDEDGDKVTATKISEIRSFEIAEALEVA